MEFNVEETNFDDDLYVKHEIKDKLLEEIIAVLPMNININDCYLQGKYKVFLSLLCMLSDNEDNNIKSVDLLSKIESQLRTHIYYNLLGTLYVNINQYEKAIDYYTISLKMKRNFAKAIINLSICLEKINKSNIKKCLKMILDVLDIYIDIPQAWSWLLRYLILLNLENESELIDYINKRNLPKIKQELNKIQ